MSLDGYIADTTGGVSWLKGHSESEAEFDAYGEFVKSIDTVVMGYNTYYQIVSELSPDEWVYSDFTSYVVTHKSPTPTKDKIIFTPKDPVSLVKELRQRDGRDIWICGGADIIGQLIRENMIDLYYITVIPTILGSGLRLFKEDTDKIDLRLTKTRHYNGMVDLVYTKRQ